MRRTGRTPIESNAAEEHIQPFRPFGPLYTEDIVNKKYPQAIASVNLGCRYTGASSLSWMPNINGNADNDCQR